jgi:hypothetical protein
MLAFIRYSALVVQHWGEFAIVMLKQPTIIEITEMFVAVTRIASIVPGSLNYTHFDDRQT